MSDARVDLSILHPFTRAEIERYITFLRQNGEVKVAQVVEAELERAPFLLRDGVKSKSAE